MKAQKALNIIMIILVIALISTISFVGIFYKNKNQMVNSIPNYILGTNLKGYREFTMILSEDQEEDEDEENQETATLEETEEEETEETESSENAENEETVENAIEENTTEENIVVPSNKLSKFRKAQNIIRNRLKSLGVEDYYVTLDRKTGNIIVMVPDNDKTDIILSDITQIGKFTIRDASTKEILIDNNDVRKVSVYTGSSSYSTATTYVYMDILFNQSGTRKLKDISLKYSNILEDNSTVDNTEAVETEEQEETEEIEEIEASSEEVYDEEAYDDEIYDGEEYEEEATSAESTEKTIDIMIDDSTLLTTSFEEINDSGTLRLTIGSSSSGTDSSDLKNQYYSGLNLAAIIENEPMPYQYEIKYNFYIDSAIQDDNIYMIVYGEIIIACIILLFMIIKFRKDGVFYAITSVGFVALLLLAIRECNVTLALEGLLAILIAFIINTVYGFIFCKHMKDRSIRNHERLQGFKKSIEEFAATQFPTIAIVLISCFSANDSLISLGMVLFWGLAISLLYNMLIYYIYVRTINIHRK